MARRKRRSFTAEFKADTVRLVREGVDGHRFPRISDPTRAVCRCNVKVSA